MMLSQTKPICRSSGEAAVEARELSYAQFLKLQLPNPHVEWVNGRVITMPPVSAAHNDLTNFFIQIFGLWMQEFDPGSEIKSDPFQMKTGPDLPGRAPDLLFVTKKNLSRLKKTYLDGPADVAIEIVSEGSRAVDRSEKYYEYERGGVREYWLFDPLRKQAEFYRLNRSSIYALAPIDAAGVFRSEVIK